MICMLSRAYSEGSRHLFSSDKGRHTSIIVGLRSVGTGVGYPFMLSIRDEGRAIGKHNFVTFALVHNVESCCDTGWISLLVKYSVTDSEVAHALPSGRCRNGGIHIESFTCPCPCLNNSGNILCQSMCNQCS